MRAYPSRKENIIKKIENFLDDISTENISLRMYSSEIKFFSKHYTNIIIEKDGHYKDTDLWDCIIYRM